MKILHSVIEILSIVFVMPFYLLYVIFLMTSIEVKDEIPHRPKLVYAIRET